MTDFNRLTKQQGLNLEAFRKNGAGAKTLVWFGEDRTTFLEFTPRAEA